MLGIINFLAGCILQVNNVHDRDASGLPPSSWCRHDASLRLHHTYPTRAGDGLGITADSFRCCCRTGIDGIRASTPPLPETFIGTGRGSQKNGDVRKTVAQQFHKFIHLIVVHIYIITPVMAFIGSERENQQFGFQGSDFGNMIRMGKC